MKRITVTAALVAAAGLIPLGSGGHGMMAGLTTPAYAQVAAGYAVGAAGATGTARQLGRIPIGLMKHNVAGMKAVPEWEHVGGYQGSSASEGSRATARARARARQVRRGPHVTLLHEGTGLILPVLKPKGVLMVPVMSLRELGPQVGVSSAGNIIVSEGNRAVVLRSGLNAYTVRSDGKATSGVWPVAPRIAHGETYVPLRVLTKALHIPIREDHGGLRLETPVEAAAAHLRATVILQGPIAPPTAVTQAQPERLANTAPARPQAKRAVVERQAKATAVQPRAKKLSATRAQATAAKPVAVSDKTFDDVVLKAGKPALVDFWATWCGPCKIQGPIVDKIAARFGGKLVVAEVNVDVAKATAVKYGIEAIPTLIFFRDGKQAGRIVGLTGEAALAARVDKLLGE